jgi:uncharacterized protein (TIGR02246 family)
MTNLDAVTAWVANYRKAWESNTAEDIAALFAEDASYFPEPFAKPWVGREKLDISGQARQFTEWWMEHK